MYEGLSDACVSKVGQVADCDCVEAFLYCAEPIAAELDASCYGRPIACFTFVNVVLALARAFSAPPAAVSSNAV